MQSYPSPLPPAALLPVGALLGKAWPSQSTWMRSHLATFFMFSCWVAHCNQRKDKGRTTALLPTLKLRCTCSVQVLSWNSWDGGSRSLGHMIRCFLPLEPVDGRRCVAAAQWPLQL